MLVQLTEIKCTIKSLIELACSDNENIAIHTTTDGASLKNNTNNELLVTLAENSCQLKSIEAKWTDTFTHSVCALETNIPQSSNRTSDINMNDLNIVGTSHTNTDNKKSPDVDCHNRDDGGSDDSTSASSSQASMSNCSNSDDNNKDVEWMGDDDNADESVMPLK